MNKLKFHLKDFHLLNYSNMFNWKKEKSRELINFIFELKMEVFNIIKRDFGSILESPLLMNIK
jgi:hypothetical protein